MTIFKSKLRYVELLLQFLILPTIVGLIVHYCDKSKPNLEVYYAVTDTKPYRKDALGKLNLNYELDKTVNRFDVSVQSVGSEPVKDVRIDIRSMGKQIFVLPDIVYNPPQIDECVLDKSLTPERMYLKLSELPIDTGVFLFTNSDDYFEKKEVKIGVIGSGRNWPAIEKQVILKSPRSTFWKNLFCEVQIPVSQVYAQDKANVTPTERKDTPKSGVYFGGYAPVTLINEIFQLLQQRKIIDENEAERIKKTTEESKPGVAIGGVNVLKFDEEVINTLIRRKVVNREEAKSMLERSRNAGGVLINGYNVIHLNAEILNALVKKNLISLEEAKAALDKSKAPKSDLR